ncbi:hypothetical protein BD310DRAFT_977436 [Dichomitus squalens]|uniref:Uncharacterized protein n=1 Tax=Dichomitus squalens TaxID=114155 RepID=A0A4Q9PUT5_9APHY|nr:hypothetical protein BD310DRAFT_977436 [Dichomitus squalens]
MDDDSLELWDMALTLFDEIGHLKPEVIKHERLKGSGVWGREFNHGLLLCLSEIDIPEKYSRKGVGSFLLRQLSISKHAPSGSFLVALPLPTVVSRNLSISILVEEWKQVKSVISRFLTKNDFRSIGDTGFLAYATDPNHPSRLLAAPNDSAKVTKASEALAARPCIVKTILPNGRMGFAIEHPDGTSSRLFDPSALDATAIDELSSLPLPIVLTAGGMDLDIPIIGKIIRDAYNKDPSSIRAAQYTGEPSALRAALYACNLAAVEALIELPLTGQTPLEAFEQEMAEREDDFGFFGTWSGDAPEAQSILYLLKQAAEENAGTWENQSVAARRWGCTCGQCTDGWLSPRMRYRLKWAAEVTADFIMLQCSDLQPDERMHSGLGLDDLPESLKADGVSKSFYVAYANAIDAVARVLKRPSRAGLPTIPSLMAEFGRKTIAFTSGGGTALHAVRCVLETARAESPLGDNTWDDMQQQDLEYGGDEMAIELASLPKCAHDLDFARVAERAGLPNPGPYGRRGLD